MTGNLVVLFEIYVQSMRRAKSFYEAVLGIRLEKMPAPTPELNMDMWFFPMDKETEMNDYGAGGMLIKMEECSLTAARAAQYSGKVCKQKQILVIMVTSLSLKTRRAYNWFSFNAVIPNIALKLGSNYRKFNLG